MPAAGSATNGGDELFEVMDDEGNSVGTIGVAGFATSWEAHATVASKAVTARTGLADRLLPH